MYDVTRFWDSPINCQKAMLQTYDIKTFLTADTQSNPSNARLSMASHNSANAHGDTTTGTATTKQLPTAETGGVLAPASIPCNDQDDAKIIRVCKSVASEANGSSSIDMSSVPGTSAELDGERALSKREVNKIASDIQKIYNANPGCLPFIAGILNSASTPWNPIVSSNPIDALWATYQKGSVHVGGLVARGHGGESSGTIGRSPMHPSEPDIALIPRNMSFIPNPDLHLSKASISKFNRGQELLRAEDALAESIHLSGAFSYSDQTMSIALAEYTGQLPPTYSPTDYDSWSRWWHPQVENRCGIGNVLKEEGK